MTVEGWTLPSWTLEGWLHDVPMIQIRWKKPLPGPDTKDAFVLLASSPFDRMVMGGGESKPNGRGHRCVNPSDEIKLDARPAEPLVCARAVGPVHHHRSHQSHLPPHRPALFLEETPAVCEGGTTTTVCEGWEIGVGCASAVFSLGATRAW